MAAAVWRRAGKSKKVPVSSTRRGYGDGDGATILGSSTTTTTTTTTTTSGTRSSSTLQALSTSEPVRDEEGESATAMELRQTRWHMRGLVDEFCAGGADGNATAPDRWLSELHVAWLLRPGESIFISRQLQSPTHTWIPALQVISTTVWKCLSSVYSDAEPIPVSEFSRFVKATLRKMLTFVDAIVALNPLDAGASSSQHQQKHVFSSGVVGAADKVRVLLDVRHALSAASEQIMMAFYSSSYQQSTIVTADIGGFLSAQQGKVDQAVRDTFDHIRTAVTPSSPGTGTLLQSSPDIHKVTRSVINYINIVLSTEALLPASYELRQEDKCSSLTTQTMEVVASLEEELDRASQTFTDQSLRFIFLINNYYFIRQLLDTSWPPHLHDLTYLSFLNSLTDRIDRYIQSYLQVSWAPVLKCLRKPRIPTSHCFMRNSPLSKFESKFQATYAAQKLWKVPDTELRKRLREVIIKEVVTGFTEYLEDHKGITPGVSPQELQVTLQELFEG